MIDIHSHLIYEVDDGAQNIHETMKMIKEAEEAGFTDIILTPHYMKNFYTVPCDEISKKIDIIKESLNDSNIQLYQGNEIYSTTDIIDLFEQKKATTLNNSRYVLMELQMQEMPRELDEVIYLILKNNKIPIIAHPERYKYVQEDPNLLLEYIERGVLFQANYGSISGVYGKTIKNTVKQLLTHNMIHFLGSDNHKPNTIYCQMKKNLKILNRWLDKEQVKALTEYNARCILENEEIEIIEPKNIRR